MDARRRRRFNLATVLPTTALAVAALAVVSQPSVLPAPRATTAAAASHSPLGRVGTHFELPGGLRARGWALDPDSQRRSLKVYATVDGRYTTSVIASKSRPSVARAHPRAGRAHGYSIRVPVREGKHRVCILAKDVGKGSNRALGCYYQNFDYGPFGKITYVGVYPGALRITGWTMDDDRVAAALTTVVRVDNAKRTVLANRHRSDTAKVRTGAGSHHGFDVTIRTGQGKHTVCVGARDVGYGADNRVGCRTVTLDNSPIAKIDKVAQESGKLRVRGWALDYDKPTSALAVTLQIDSAAPRTITAKLSRSDVGVRYPRAGRSHGFDERVTLSEGTHRVCISVRDVGYGSSRSMGCRSVALRFTPTAALTSLTASSTGFSVKGWASDPDTTKAIAARVTVDGKTKATVTASAKGSSHSGHNFTTWLATRTGKHTVCVIGVNTLYGRSDSKASCRTITLALKPLGRFESVARSGGSNLLVKGWAFDPDTSSPISVVMTIDGKTAATVRAAATRSDVGRSYPSAGPVHGYSAVLAANDGKHTVCATAVYGSDRTSLGCRVINAVHPKVASAPRSVHAKSGYGSAVVSWSAPTSDGGAPWTKYVVVASPGGRTATAAATATSVTVTGLATKTSYTFTVRAVNVAGSSPAGTSARVTTQAGPAPQTTPAPVSTSRYIRNIRGSSSAEQAVMRKEGAADAKANPSGHKYMVLLDIGGQNRTYGGVVLSATTRFVSYADLVRDIKAYLDGYHSAQRSTAPVTIAVGTNNDMDVSASTGRAWATSVVNPLVSYAKKYSGMIIAGANDIEPGFSASYSATKSWLGGYLSATSARFVFNGSADGCAWTTTNRGCNNGWSMAGLYYLAEGAVHGRMVNLPQVYNYTMADQWKYISLTGIGQGKSRINFGGPLTEYTACAQAKSCGSIGGTSAWKRMWSNLQSHSKLKIGSLPYATDLRIDR